VASCGLDFGTSNSAVALPSGEVLQVSPGAREPRLFRSVLFFPEGETAFFTGQEAIDRYLEDGAGRFLQSVKAWLPSASFGATQIRNRPFTLEELVAMMLRRLREAASACAKVKLDDVVLGRPAAFSDDPAADALAEQRLRRAAELAGFRAIRFVIEPIAAALDYEARLTTDELVLVADFGAGTSDFTLMRLGPSRRGKVDRRDDVVASAGVRIGGDRFDAEIMRHKLLTHFGSKSTYSEPFSTQRLSVPNHVLRKLLSWHEMSFIREKSTQDLIARMLKSGDDVPAVQALQDLVMENLGYHLFRAIEAAKVELSSHDKARLEFHEARIDLSVHISRAEFERACEPLLRGLDECVAGLLARAGKTEPIDAVFLTGGSSQLPAVRALFARQFGEGRLRTADAFTSVVSGLGRAAAVNW
jgi:hypothetical chaperone protein